MATEQALTGANDHGGRVKHDIVIIGGSSAGMTAAALLAEADFAVALVEPTAGPEPGGALDKRTVALTAHSVQLLDRLGFPWEQRRYCDWRQVVVEEADSPVPLHFRAEDTGRASLGRLVEIPELNSGLRQIIAAQEIQVYQEAAREMREQPAGVQVLLSQGQVLEAGLVVAADGAESWVRQQLGIGLTWHDYQQQAIVAVVTCNRPHAHRAWQRFTHGFPLAFLPMAASGAAQYSLVWSLPTAEATRLMCLSDADFITELQKNMARELGQIQQISQRCSFPLVARHALSYYAMKAVLVGDSAHTIHPLAGQGLNLGLADVEVLAEELLRARQRRLPLAHLSVLQRYQRRRQADNQRMQDGMTALQRLMGTKAPLLRVLRGQTWSCIERQPWLKGLILDMAFY